MFDCGCTISLFKKNYLATMFPQLSSLGEGSCVTIDTSVSAGGGGWGDGRVALQRDPGFLDFRQSKLVCRELHEIYT